MYTKGEWKALKYEHFLIIGEDGGVIAIVHKPHHPDTGEELANAHLISSAPELYEVLREAQGYIARKEMYAGVQDRTELEVKIIKALAKARGE